MPETILLRPADLIFDEQNPRISTPNSGQREAHRAIAQVQDSKLIALARHIIEHGMNPADSFIVMEREGDPKRYLALEGNRRLSALKALENPEVVSGAVSSGTLAKLRKLSAAYQGNPVDWVQCLVVRNRDEARPWIELRHTGLNEGAGVLPWGSDESSRFRARSSPIEFHTQILDFLEKGGHLSGDDRRNIPASSFRRLVGTPEVRDKLGIDKENGELRLTAKEKDVAKALMHVIRSLADGETKVGDIYHREQRLDYAENLPPSVAITPSKKTEKRVVASVSSTAESPKQPKGASRVRAKPRNKLIPPDCSLNVTDSRLREIETELRRLSLDDYSNAISVLFRVFLELTVDSYIQSSKLGVTRDSTLRRKLLAVAGDLLKHKKLTKGQVAPVRRACQRDSYLAPSINMMHQYVHNPHISPEPSDLRVSWNNLQPFIVAAWSA